MTWCIFRTHNFWLAERVSPTLYTVPLRLHRINIPWPVPGLRSVLTPSKHLVFAVYCSEECTDL